MSAPEILCPYDTRVRSSIVFDGESRTKQAFKEECDINRILSSYMRTGIVQGAATPPTYGDLSPIDYQSALNLIIEAEEAFDSLPSALRKRFDNDPSEYLSFASNPDNRDEMIKLGLLDAPAPDPSPVRVVIDNPTPTPSES